MKGKQKILAFLMAILSIVLVACGNGGNKENSNVSSSSNQENEKMTIVTSFAPMEAFTKAVVGDKAKVEVLVKGDTEAHEYDPSAKDMATLEKAKVFVYSNDEMEHWAKKVAEGLSKDTTVVVAGKEIKLKDGNVTSFDGKILTHEDLEAAEEGEEADHDHEGEDHDHEGKEPDPHTWLSPVAAQKEVQTIADAISKVDPDNAETYKKNAGAYIQQLKDLDKAYHQAFDNAKNVSFVTAHAAFKYLAEEYGLKQYAVTGVAEVSDPSPKRMAEVQDFLKKNKISVMYTEEGISPSVAETLTKGTGAKIMTLKTLEMAPKDGNVDGKTYIDAMKDNLKNLKASIK